MPEGSPSPVTPGQSRHLAAILAVTIAPPALQSRKVDAEIAAAGGTAIGEVDRTRFAEFHNARGAVLCAMRLQSIEGARGIRIGVHLGEMAGGEDALSSRGAQVAALVAGIADPGGLALSNVVYGQVKRMYHLRGTNVRSGGHRTFVSPPQGAAYLPWLLRKRKVLAAGVVAALAGAAVAAGGIWFMKGCDVRLSLPAPKLKPSGRTLSVKPVPGMLGEALMFEWGEDEHLNTCDADFPQPASWRGAVGIRLGIKGTPGATVYLEAWENSRVAGQSVPGELWEFGMVLPENWREVMIPFAAFRFNQYHKSDPANINGILEPEEVGLMTFSFGAVSPAGGQFCFSGASLVMRRRPGNPYLGDGPSGPKTAAAGEPVQWTAVPVSREKLPLRCICDWGDGTTDETNGIYTGDSARMTHRWTVPGKFHVRARAVDIEGRSSAFSGPVMVEVVPADVLLEDFGSLGRVYEWANPGCTVSKSQVQGDHGPALRLAITAGKKAPRPTAGFSLEENIAGKNWTQYGGMRARARSERRQVIWLKIHEKGRGNDAKGGEIWEFPLKAGPEWQEFYAPFAEFRPSQEEEIPADDPNGRLDLDRIAGIAVHLGRNRGKGGYADTIHVDDLFLAIKAPEGKGAGK